MQNNRRIKASGPRLLRHDGCGLLPGVYDHSPSARRLERLAAAGEALEAGEAGAAEGDASQLRVGGWLGRNGNSHATADLLALSTTTHADGLSGHLLNGLLLGVSDGGMDRRGGHTGCWAS